MDLFCDAHDTTARFGSHVGELRRLFVFHGLSCGLTESFGALGTKLAESKAFRTDISALARSVRDQEKGNISSDEMLTVVALAIGGEELVDGRSPGVGIGSTVGVLRVLLDAIGGWRETGEDQPAMAFEGGHSAESPVVHEISNERTDDVKAGVAAILMPSLRGGDGIVADLRSYPIAYPASNGHGGETPAVVAGPQDRVELAIRELKVYLDDIDRRMSRLEPHVEDLSQTVHGAVQRLERPAKLEPELDGRLQPSEAMNAEMTHAASPEDGVIGDAHDESVEDQIEHDWVAFETLQGEREDSRERDSEAVPVSPISEPLRDQPTSGSAWEDDQAPGDQGERKPEDIWVPPSVMRTPASDESRPEPIHWRERIGLWMAFAAVVFGIVGIAGLARLWQSPDQQQVSASSVKVAATGAVASPAAPPDARAARDVSEVKPEPVKKLTEKDLGQSSAARGAPPQRSEGPDKAAPVLRENAASRTGRLEVSSKGGTVAPIVLARDKAPEAMVRKETPRHEASSPPIAKVKEAAEPITNLTLRAGASDGRPRVEVRSAAGKVVAARTPVYPADAVREGREAKVVLHAFLAKDGSVRRMDVVQGAYGFNKSAMDAVWSWRYLPQTVHGKPVEAETQITVDYRLH